MTNSEMQDSSNVLSFLSNGGQSGKQIIQFDWSATSLGDLHCWSSNLKTLVQLILASKQPMFVAWGPERIWLHNDAFVPIAGERHLSAIGRPSGQVWPEFWPEMSLMFDQVFGGEPVQMTDFTAAIDRDGAIEDAYFDFSHTPVRGEDGAVVGLFGVCNETTGRVKSDRKLLAEAEREKNRLFEMTRDLFGVATFNGDLVSINPAWSRQLGRRSKDMLSHSFAEIIHPDDLATTAEVVATLQAGEPVHQFHVRLLKLDGTPVSFSWSAVPEGSGSDVFYTVGRDITEDLAAAAELAVAQEALRQSQKMEAIGNLTGGVAHDFNNLLQVVAGNLQLLARDMEGNEKAERRISNALTGVSRGAKLAAQLLAFGRRQALEPKVVNISRLVANMDEMLRRTIGEGVEIETIVSGGVPSSFIDPAQTENALLNLAINARDAMDGYGKLTIEVGYADVGQGNKLLHDDIGPGQYVTLCVTDTGSGIPPELLAKVWEPFYSTKPEGKGTGLGLSMVYGFVKQTGGHVRIYSEIGHGTTVRMYLPRSLEVEHLESEGSDLPVAGGTETILVAEDDEGVRTTAIELLEELGYRVLKAPDAASALSILESGSPVDLLFTDVIMPGPLKSSDLAKMVADRWPETAVLFTSGYTENSIVHGGRLDPGVQLLSKPYTREQLARKIRRALEVRGH